MKNIIIRLMITAAGCLTFGIAAQAQSVTHYRANVPFDFTVGNKAYGAGKYVVGPASTLSTNGAILLIDKRTGNGRILAFGDQGVARSSEGKLTFKKVGNRYSLIMVSTPSFGLKINEPKRMAIAMAKNTAEFVEIKLN